MIELVGGGAADENNQPINEPPLDFGFAT